MLAFHLPRSMMSWQKHKESWKRSYKNLKPIHQGKGINNKNKCLGKQVFLPGCAEFQKCWGVLSCSYRNSRVRKLPTWCLSSLSFTPHLPCFLRWPGPQRLFLASVHSHRNPFCDQCPGSGSRGVWNGQQPWQRGSRAQPGRTVLLCDYMRFSVIDFIHALSPYLCNLFCF